MGATFPNPSVKTLKPPLSCEQCPCHNSAAPGSQGGDKLSQTWFLCSGGDTCQSAARRVTLGVSKSVPPQKIPGIIFNSQRGEQKELEPVERKKGESGDTGVKESNLGDANKECPKIWVQKLPRAPLLPSRSTSSQQEQPGAWFGHCSTSSLEQIWGTRN